VKCHLVKGDIKTELAVKNQTLFGSRRERVDFGVLRDELTIKEGGHDIVSDPDQRDVPFAIRKRDGFRANRGITQKRTAPHVCPTAGFVTHSKIGRATDAFVRVQAQQELIFLLA